jgi:hypothetical protein
MQSQQGSTLPAHFPAVAGNVYPLYHVLADVNELAVENAESIPIRSEEPLTVEAMAMACGRRTRILVANFSPQRQRVCLVGLRDIWHARWLDQTTYAVAASSAQEYRQTPPQRVAARQGELQLELRPYGLVTLDQLAAAA